MQEKIDFKNGDIAFRGKVFRPEVLAQCKGIIVFTHGLGYCDRQYKIDGESFVSHGYMFVAYNLRGHAGTDGIWTLEDSVQDLVQLISALVATYDFPNRERICLMGHSTGALISLLASIRDPRIKFGSMVTTVTSLAHSYRYWFKSGFNVQAKEVFKSKGIIPPIIDRFMDDPALIDQYCAGKIPKAELDVPHRYGLLKAKSWDQFFHEIAFSVDILEQVDKIKIPLLLFRGENDEVMDVKKTNELYEKLSNRVPVKLFITDSLNHFHNDRWPLIQQETLRFFDEFCAPARSVGQEVRSILIVDDDALVAKTLANVFKKEPLIRVELASSGEMALEKFNASRSGAKGFDLIIADIRMPGLDGLETTKRMKDISHTFGEKEKPVIFITGYEGARTQEEARSIGYLDYLYKPVDMERLLRCVKKQLGL